MTRKRSNRAGPNGLTKPLTDRARKLGFTSFYAMCVARKVSYPALIRVYRDGITKRTEKATLDALDLLGIRDMVKVAV